MSVHYKFKSALEYDTVTFDGLHISVKDLKNAIIQQKRIGKNTDFDLQVTNAQTKEVYEDENVLIPKNTSLLIARIPTSVQTKNKQWEGYGGDSTPPNKLDEGGPIAKAVDLSSLDAPEDDKIKAMMSQSTQDYDPSNYLKIRGANQMGAVPPNYRCYKCHQTGHWIKDCPLSKGPEPIEIKKSTGIPLSFMVPVEGPQVQGAMMTPNGSYAVPVLDHQTYTQKPAPAPVLEAKAEIPEDLLCSICSDLLSDAVMIPCCGNSFCDECIRSLLLESEDRECPECHEKDISPGTLIPNRFLRNSVANFKNTTGYVKKPVYKQAMKKTSEDAEIKGKEPPEAAESKVEEKTVISEADSTEPPKVDEKPEGKKSPRVEVEEGQDGPPGVSPVESPKPISKRVNSSRERSSTSRHKHRSRDESPRRHHRTHRSPPYQESNRSEERAGTPTVDEPGIGTVYPSQDSRTYSSSSIPMMGVPAMQGPPPAMPAAYSGQQMGSYPQAAGPPPNFRMPPPGSAPPPYMAPGPYQVAPRPMYDTSRPPISGPPPLYGANYPSGRSHHRDYGMSDRRMRGRTPSGRYHSRVIDDPLAAFNRMLREKDERERRAKRVHRRSYSRSRSRSYSRSPLRMRSRSPRRRRSRSRSFSISRHRFKEERERFRNRDYDDHEREHPREERGYSREREDRDGRRTNRDFAYYEGFDDRNRNKDWSIAPRGPEQGFYQGDVQHYASNRFPPRDYQFKNEVAQPTVRRFEDVAPPGVEEPPVPGLEDSPRFEKSPERKRKRSPSVKRSPSPRRKSKEKDTSPEKHKKKKKEDLSDEEKTKKSKEKKRKKDKKDPEKKKRKEKKEKHKKEEKKHKEEVQEETKVEIKLMSDEIPETTEEEFKQAAVEGEETVPKADLYDDLPSEVDINVVETYGKVQEKALTPEIKDLEDSEEKEEILDLHPTDIDLKTEDVKNEMLAHLPEKSKWEVEDEVQSSPKESGKFDVKEKPGKVTNEVLKRAENAIFAKAINAIRPIELKKTKTNSDEEKEEKKTEPPPRISVKDRLGVKVDDEKLMRMDRNKSRSLSPFTRRSDRRVEVIDRRRRDRSPRHRDRNRRDYKHDEYRRRDRREGSRKKEEKKPETKTKIKTHDEEKRRKRSKSHSEIVKKKEKKTKKEKSKKDEKKDEKLEEKKSVAEKRKPTIDESNFEPDYDLESESEKEEKKEKKIQRKSSSSSDSSETSSDDDKKKKKHKKRKKKSKKDSSSSSSESESESSDDEKRRKKHKKKQRKRKKSKK